MAQLSHVGEAGCGYEAPLEAMYRFLVDPEPPLTLATKTVGETTSTVVEGVDEEVLAARAKFLRPLSQVLVIFLTDEDDCSVIDNGEGWKVGSAGQLARATEACSESPKSPCCRSCDTVEQTPPKGCVRVEDDTACKKSVLLTPDEDPQQLRCWDQTRRFGKSFLFPVERYTAALRAPTLTARDGRSVPNPLFTYGRTPDMVSVLAITGAPWQLLTTEESQTNPQITDYLSPQAFATAGGWERILGAPAQGVPPSDPHLLATPEPRPGLAVPGGVWDPMHGHEIVRAPADDLQFSCVFPLPEPKACQPGHYCPCDGNPVPQSPLCRQPDNSYGQIPQFAGAAPPPRLLQFVKSLGNSGSLGSICPRQLTDVESSSYGYVGALAAFRNASFATFSGSSCFREKLPTDAAGRPLCKLIEVHDSPVNCEAIGRKLADPGYAKPALARAMQNMTPVTACEIPAMPGEPRDPSSAAYACAHDLHYDRPEQGYCYIDPGLDLGSEELVQMCITFHKRRVRVIPSNIALPDTYSTFICKY